MLFPSLLLSSLSLLSVVQAQLFTSTLPFEDGDTLLVSRYTVAGGVFAYSTLSTVNGFVPATTTTRAVTTARTTTTAAAVATTTAQRVVGQDASIQTTAETTFTYTTTDAAGEKILRTAIFTPSFAPDATPVAVPEGSIIDYSAYAATVQPALESQASAAAAAASSAGISGGARTLGLGLGVGFVGAVALGAGGWLLGGL
ncbi:hypothetical protein BDY24DRAFT_376597 [Mrakia frigida]|uniref:uncharacterized protein n=1 Tax=Mrakia frigida TaxID=29902 RepID=UPI003FCBF4A9